MENFIYLVGFVALCLSPWLICLVAQYFCQRYMDKMRLKHPDFAIAVKQFSYARHRFKSHRSCVLMPLLNNISQLEFTPLSWDYQRNDLRKQAIQQYKKDLDFEAEVSKTLFEDYQQKKEKVKALAKNYKIKLDKGFLL